LLGPLHLLLMNSNTLKKSYDRVCTIVGCCPRFPVQFSIEVIKTRLENNYYRNLEAVGHDATVMIDNAQSYFSKSTEMTKKIRKLADWIEQTFLSL
jgi:hypothetical protein